MSTRLNTRNTTFSVLNDSHRQGQTLFNTRLKFQSGFTLKDSSLNLSHVTNFKSAYNYNARAKNAKKLLKVSAELEAIVFDCDGVILESEDLHRRAYNATFGHFSLRCPINQNVIEWKPEFYDVLQNKIGGGKPKMRWYFEEHGWPVCSILPMPPKTAEEKELLLDTLQDRKTYLYKEMIGSGQVETRPGILRIMDEAKSKGIKVAVCSAATKSSVVFALESLLGKDRFESLDCFLAGDDVDKKKPDPTIYTVAAKKLGLDASKCLVVEDSMIGLQAAIGAGMNCMITYTDSTKSQAFPGAVSVVPNLGSTNLDDLRKLLSVLAL